MVALHKMIGKSSGSAIILLALVAAGIFGGYLYWLKMPAEPEPKQSVKQDGDKGKKAGQESEDKFQFDFFSMLPEEEYACVEERPRKQSESSSKKSGKKKQPVKRSSTPRGNYLIQLGAFRSKEAADKQKAELILNGFENVQINRDKTSKGALYRVDVGPYQSFSSADHEKQRLNSAGYKSFLKKYVSNSQAR